MSSPHIGAPSFLRCGRRSTRGGGRGRRSPSIFMAKRARPAGPISPSGSPTWKQIVATDRCVPAPGGTARSRRWKSAPRRLLARGRPPDARRPRRPPPSLRPRVRPVVRRARPWVRDDEVAAIPDSAKKRVGAAGGRTVSRLQQADVGEPPPRRRVSPTSKASSPTVPPPPSSVARLRHCVAVRRAGEGARVRGAGDDGGDGRSERLHRIDLGRHQVLDPTPRHEVRAGQVLPTPCRPSADPEPRRTSAAAPSPRSARWRRSVSRPHPRGRPGSCCRRRSGTLVSPPRPPGSSTPEARSAGRARARDRARESGVAR